MSTARGNGGNGNTISSIEFIVKPTEDLYLEGSRKSLLRVTEGQEYPCQMQKDQSFSCLFRHYAKHNGLKKEDLVFYFTDELMSDQKPETVQLMHQDVISVSHRKSEEVEMKQELDAQTYSNNFYNLLMSGIHSDITFIIDETNEEIKAHKAILSSRSQYFTAMFRDGGMVESSLSHVHVKNHDKLTFSRMLEFIYTNGIKEMEKCSPDEVISLLMMANEYVLDDLRVLCQQTAKTLLSLENIGKFLLLSQHNNAEGLKKSCGSFIREKSKELKTNEYFKQEIHENPELGVLVFEAMDDDSTEVGVKRNRNGNSKDVGPPTIGLNSNTVI